MGEKLRRKRKIESKQASSPTPTPTRWKKGLHTLSLKEEK
jgi:hypothetical protein